MVFCTGYSRTSRHKIRDARTTGGFAVELDGFDSGAPYHLELWRVNKNENQKMYVDQSNMVHVENRQQFCWQTTACQIGAPVMINSCSTTWSLPPTVGASDQIKVFCQGPTSLCLGPVGGAFANGQKMELQDCAAAPFYTRTIDFLANSTMHVSGRLVEFHCCGFADHYMR